MTGAAHQRQHFGRRAGVRVPYRRTEPQRREVRNRDTGGAEGLGRQPGLIAGVFGYLLALFGEPHPGVGAEAGAVGPVPPGRGGLRPQAGSEGYRDDALSGTGRFRVGEQVADRRGWERAASQGAAIGEAIFGGTAQITSISVAASASADGAQPMKRDSASIRPSGASSDPSLAGCHEGAVASTAAAP